MNNMADTDTEFILTETISSNLEDYYNQNYKVTFRVLQDISEGGEGGM